MLNPTTVQYYMEKFSDTVVESDEMLEVYIKRYGYLDVSTSVGM